MNRTPKLYQGLITFVLVIVIMIFVISPIQYYIGFWGLAISELIFLAIAATAFIFTKSDFRAVFKLKLPPIHQFFGSAMIYFGSYCVVLTMLLIITWIFPEINDVANAITDIGTQVSPGAAVLVMAVMPAICEEALHRGFILSSFSKVKYKTVIVIAMGVIFGIFHLDPYRFLPTMFLGMIFTYIAIETNSIVLPMLFHFINNLMAVISMFSSTPDSAVQIEITSEMLLYSGIFYMMIGLILITGGWFLLHRRKSGIR